MYEKSDIKLGVWNFLPQFADKSVHLASLLLRKNVTIRDLLIPKEE